MESSGGDYYGKQFPQTQRISHICDKLIHTDMYGVKDFPSRHNLPVQGLPHILDKSFHSDFSQRPGFQLPTLTSPMHDKTFHTAMMAYGKEFSPSIPGLQTPKLSSNLMENGGVSAEKQFLHQQGQALQTPKMSSSLEKSYPSSHKHYTPNQSLQSPQLPTSMADKSFSLHSPASSGSSVSSSGSNSMITDKHHLLQQSHNMLLQKINSPVHKPFPNNSLSNKPYTHCSSSNQIMHSSQHHLKQAMPNVADKSYYANSANNSNTSNASDILSTQSTNLYSHSIGMQSQKSSNATIEKSYLHENLSILGKQYLQSHTTMSVQKMPRISDKHFSNGNMMQGRELLSPNPEQLHSSSVVNMVEKQRYLPRDKTPNQHHYQAYIPPSTTAAGYHSQSNFIEKPLQQPLSPLQSPPQLPTMQSPTPPSTNQTSSALQSPPPPPPPMRSPMPLQSPPPTSLRSPAPLHSPPPSSMLRSPAPLQSPPPSSMLRSPAPLQSPPPSSLLRSPAPLQSPPPSSLLRSPAPLQSPPPPPQSSPSMQSPSPQHQPTQYKRQISSENYQPAILPSQLTKQQLTEEVHIEKPVETSCSYMESLHRMKMHSESLEKTMFEANDQVSNKEISSVHIVPLPQNPDNQITDQVPPAVETAVSSSASCSSSSSSTYSSSATIASAPSCVAVTSSIRTGVPESRYHCEFCGKQFAQKYVLQMHRRTHTGEKPFQCDFCIQRFARKDTLKIHRRIHTGETPFQCDLCPKQFAQASKLLKHKKRCHMVNKKRQNTNDAKPLQTPNPEQPEMQLQPPIELKTENEILPQLQAPKTESQNPPRRKNLVTCDICLKQFAHRDYLTVHKRSHTGERPFRCDFCPQRFTRRDMLQVHRRTHTGEKPFECTICLKRFAQRDKLHIHTRVHTGEKPYKCQICSKQFSQRNTLVGHLRSHSGERPYQCEICLRRFAQKDYLRVHTRSHTGEKPYECDFCIQKFSRRDTLIIHRRIHTGEKPFRCEFCDKQFAQTDKLRRHRRTHPEFKQALITGTSSFNKKLNIVKSEVDMEIKTEANPVESSDTADGTNNQEDSKAMLVPVKSIDEYAPVNNYLWLL